MLALEIVLWILGGLGLVDITISIVIFGRIDSLARLLFWLPLLAVAGWLARRRLRSDVSKAP